MKKTVKRAARKTTPKRTTRRTVHKSAEHVLFLPFSFRRIILVSTCLVLFLLAFVVFKKEPLSQSVAGMSITRGLFGQATVTIKPVDNAVAYNIYYKQITDSKYIHAVRHIPTNVTTYTISYLKKDKQYQYKISALDASGKEFWWSDLQTFTATQSM
jgi:hypothetical protein